MVRLEEFKESGFYLVFADGTRLRLTPEAIQAFAREFLDDPIKVPPEVKKAVDFQACSICPKQHSGEFCHALRPTLPFISEVDRHESFEPVTAIHRDNPRTFTAIKDATMQTALQYVSILSLIHYCEVGQQYRDFFMGLTPLMEFDDALHRIYLNIFWLNQGDSSRIRATIEAFCHDLTITSKCQVNRLWLISRNDAFINAFCKTHLITHFLSCDMEEQMRKALEAYRQQSEAH